MSPASGGPYLPQNYAPRPAGHNPGDVQIATRVAGHSEPLETIVEPVTAEPVIVGNTDVAVAMSAQRCAPQQLQEYLDGLEPRRRSFTREGYEAQRRAFAKTRTIEAATQWAPQVARDRVERAEREVTAEIKALAPDGDLETELRASRIWDRTKHSLDSKDKGGKVSAAAKLVEDADPAELAVYLQELPAYLDAEGLPSDWLNSVLEEKVPNVAEKINKRTLAIKAAAGIRNNAARLEQAAREGRQTYVGLLDYQCFDPDANSVA
jgi:hypothetical protein